MEDNNQPNDNLKNKQQEEKVETNIPQATSVEPKTEEVPVTPVVNEVPQPKQAPVQNVEQEVKKFNNYTANVNETKTKKGNGKTIGLIIAIILGLAIIGGLVYYFMFYTKPDQMYKRLLNSTMDSYTNTLKNADYNTSKTVIKLSANIDADDDNEIIDFINKTDIGLEVQTDNENKQVVINLDSNYDNDSLLNLQMYSDVEDETTYVYLKDWLKKYIEVEMNNSEYYSALSEFLESQKVSSDQKLALQKAMLIIKKELTTVVKPEYCSSQKEDVKINDKTVNTTKNTIKFTLTQFKNEFKTVCENLRNNNEFIQCFEDQTSVEDSLDSMVEKLEDMDDDDKSTIEINIYTEGLLQNIVKFDVKAYSDKNETTVTIAVIKTSDTVYNFNVISSGDKETTFNGTFDLNKKNDSEGTAKVSFEVENFGKVELKLDYSQKYNEDIEKVNVKNSVKSEELSTADQKKLMENLQKSKLYELISAVSGSSLTGTNSSSDSLLNTTTSTDDDDEDENTTTTTSTDDSNKTTTKDNEVISYNDQFKITYGIPDGYKVRTTSDNYKTLEKEDTSVKLSTIYGNKDKYYESLESTKKSYEEASTYKNINLSKIEEKEVSGKKYYTAIFSYEYVSGSYSSKYSTTYYWTELSDKYVLDITLRDADDLSEDDLNKILTIKVDELKK